LYANFQAALPQSASKNGSTMDVKHQSAANIREMDNNSVLAQHHLPLQSLIVASALENAFDKLDT
jgi:hypothetical protein